MWPQGYKARQAEEKRPVNDRALMPPEWRTFDQNVRNFKVLKVATALSRWSKMSTLLLYKGMVVDMGGLTNMLDTIRLQRVAQASNGSAGAADAFTGKKLSRILDDDD